MQNQPLNVTLKDHAPNFSGELNLRIAPEGFGVAISPEGYEFGSAIFLELYEGRFRVLVWADEDDEDPTHIVDLGGTSETRREVRMTECL